MRNLSALRRNFSGYFLHKVAADDILLKEVKMAERRSDTERNVRHERSEETRQPREVVPGVWSFSSKAISECFEIAEKAVRSEEAATSSSTEARVE
jgi:hypothetical protein